MGIYLMPFDTTVTIERELRVFVNNDRVTAMSQYDIFNLSSSFASKDDVELAEVAKLVVQFHDELLLPRWKAVGGTCSYVMDVEYVADQARDGPPQIRLIELNTFGAEMAAGSALFHWVHDHDTMYESDSVCIR